MASGSHKCNKPELKTIYRLEFYRNQKKWKFSNERKKDSKPAPNGPAEEKITKNLNRTYDLEPSYEYEKEVPLNNAFIHEIPTDDTPEDNLSAPQPTPHPPRDHQLQEIYPEDTYCSTDVWFNSDIHRGTEMQKNITDYQPNILQLVPNNDDQQANMYCLPNQENSPKVNNRESDLQNQQTEQLWSVQTSDEDTATLMPHNMGTNPVIQTSPANVPDREMLANLLKKQAQNFAMPPPTTCLQTLFSQDKWKNQERRVPSHENHRKTGFWTNPALVTDRTGPYKQKNELEANMAVWNKQMEKGTIPSLSGNFSKSTNSLSGNPESFINQVPDILPIYNKFQKSDNLVNVNMEPWNNQVPTSPIVSSLTVQKSNNLINSRESGINQIPPNISRFTRSLNQDCCVPHTVTPQKFTYPQNNYQVRNQEETRPDNLAKPGQIPPILLQNISNKICMQTNQGITWGDSQKVPCMDPCISSDPAALQYTWRNQNRQKPELSLIHNIQQDWSPISVDNPDGMQSSEDPHQVDLQISAVEQSTLKPHGSTEGVLTPEQIRRSTDEWLRKLLALYQPKDECTDSDMEINQGNDSTEFIREAHEVPHSSEKDFNETRECVCSYIPMSSLPSLSSSRLSAAIQHGTEVLRNVLKEQLIRDNLRSLTLLNVVEYPTRDTDLFGTEYVQGGSHLPHSHKYLPHTHEEERGIKIDMGRPYRL